MKQLSKNKISAFILFGISILMVMLVSAIPVKAETRISTFNLSDGEFTMTNTLATQPSKETWTIKVNNDTSDAKDIKIKVEATKIGTVSSAPSLEIQDNITYLIPTVNVEAKDYTAKDNLISIPGFMCLDFVFAYDGYPNGGGSYALKVTMTATDKACEHKWRAVSGSTDAKCDRCAAICKHPKFSETEYIAGGSEFHTKIQTCAVCGLYISKSEKHVKGKYVYKYTDSDGNSIHEVNCKGCGQWLKNEKCIHNAKTRTGSKKLTAFVEKGVYHKESYKCSSCNHKFSHKVKHTFKNNKCKVCGFKQVKPSKLKNVSLKFTSAPKKKTYSMKGYWTLAGHWTPATKFNYYSCKVKLTYKKPSNVAKVKIKIGGRHLNATSNKEIFYTKNTISWNFDLRGPLVLEITPYSKTGIAGKTIVKKLNPAK